MSDQSDRFPSGAGLQDGSGLEGESTLDAYDILFEHYPRRKFFEDGLASIRYVAEDEAMWQWEELRSRLMSGRPVFIRGFGRDAKGTEAFTVLYKHLFGNENVKKDPDNNYQPTRLIGEMTGLVKRPVSIHSGLRTIRNFQISHLFGRTKNPVLFTAAWNIAYVPKFLDPFTGHEAKGGHVEDFQRLFAQQNLNGSTGILPPTTISLRSMLNRNWRRPWRLPALSWGLLSSRTLCCSRRG